MVYVETSDILLGQRCLEFEDDWSCSLDLRPSWELWKLWEAKPGHEAPGNRTFSSRLTRYVTTLKGMEPKHTQTHKHMGILWDSLVANLLEMPFCRGHDQLPLFSHKVEGVMTSKRSKQSALSFLQSLGKAFWLSFSEMQEILITNEQIFQGA